MVVLTALMLNWYCINHMSNNYLQKKLKDVPKKEITQLFSQKHQVLQHCQQKILTFISSTLYNTINHYNSLFWSLFASHHLFFSKIQFFVLQGLSFLVGVLA